ncbi:MAG: DoxX family protein [Gemmataceae bacterium]
MTRAAVVRRWVLGLAFVAAGVNHFVQPDFYTRLMPPYLPWHAELVFLSGVAEVALGLLALPARTAPAAGWGLVALLVAVFPANVHMAMNPELFPEIPAWVPYARLPLQGVFIWWAYRWTRGAS